MKNYTKNKKTYNQKSKKKFRDSKRWKDFRRQMYEQSGRECAVTGNKLTRLWQLHHMDMAEEHYENLKPENFVCQVFEILPATAFISMLPVTVKVVSKVPLVNVCSTPFILTLVSWY